MMDQEVLKQLKAGDIVLYGGVTFISKAIQFMMRIQRAKQGLPIPRGTIASHAGTLVNLWGQIYIAEARPEGIVVSPFLEKYRNSMESIKILTPKKTYSISEGERISKLAIEDSLTPHRYDFFGIWFQLKMTLTGKWSGPTGDDAERKLYCTEAVATWANKIRPGTFTKEEAAGPLEVEFNKYYKIIYDGSKIE